MVSGQWQEKTGQTGKSDGAGNMAVRHYSELIAWQKAMDLVNH